MRVNAVPQLAEELWIPRSEAPQSQSSWSLYNPLPNDYMSVPKDHGIQAHDLLEVLFLHPQIFPKWGGGEVNSRC